MTLKKFCGFSNQFGALPLFDGVGVLLRVQPVLKESSDPVEMCHFFVLFLPKNISESVELPRVLLFEKAKKSVNTQKHVNTREHGLYSIINIPS